jgi:hypothetical protein
VANLKREVKQRHGELGATPDLAVMHDHLTHNYTICQSMVSQCGWGSRVAARSGDDGFAEAQSLKQIVKQCSALFSVGCWCCTMCLILGMQNERHRVMSAMLNVHLCWHVILVYGIGQGRTHIVGQLLQSVPAVQMEL